MFPEPSKKNTQRVRPNSGTAPPTYKFTGARPIVSSENKMYDLMGIIGDVSVKLPKSVDNFLFSGFHIIGRTPVVV
jgi:hypothetical protein